MTEEKKTRTRKKEPKPAEAEAKKVHEKKEEPKAEESKPVETKKEEPKKEAKKPRKKSAAKKGKASIARGKRKLSIARATVVPGRGIVRVNSLNVNAFNNKYLRGVITEPLKFLGPEMNKVDVHVNVNGGGMMGRAQAARTAIANALVQYFDDSEMEKKMLEFDRSLLIADARRVESKKFKGPKARARFQKSYR